MELDLKQFNIICSGGTNISKFDHKYAPLAIAASLFSLKTNDNILKYKIMSNCIECRELRMVFPIINPYSLKHGLSFNLDKERKETVY